MTEYRGMPKQTPGAEEDEARIRELLSEAGRRPEVPAEDRARLKAAARLEWQSMVAAERDRKRRTTFRTSLALAAGLLVALLAGWFWAREKDAPIDTSTVASVELLRGTAALERAGEPGRTLATGEELLAGSTIETGGESSAALALGGGHSARLDAASRARLVSPTRIELQRGAVYLDSGTAPDAATVEVATPFGVVRDIGTRFEVRLQNDADPALRVRVRDGEISISRNGDSYSAGGGEELTVWPTGLVGRESVEPFGPDWSWVLSATPSPNIEGMPLPAFLARVSRETGWQVSYADAELERAAAAVRLSGSTEGLTLEESVRVVFQASGFDYRVENGSLLVLRTPG